MSSSPNMHSDEKSPLRGVLLVALLLSVVGAVVLTAGTVRVRMQRANDRELMRVGLEDVARRVKANERNLATIAEMNNTTLLTKARAFSRIVAKDPSLVEDRERFAAFAKTLDVDELHVSDERGVLVQSYPAAFVGFDMNSSVQSRPFMRAISDASFELAQEPMHKGSDGQLFQYAGVARLDRAGIVQVGQSADRVAEARKLADIAEITTSTRIGREGRVFVTPLAESRGKAGALKVSVIGGVRMFVLSSDVDAFRVTAMLPVAGSRLADDVPFTCLCVLDILVLVVLLAVLTPGVRRAMAENFHSLEILFAGTEKRLAKGRLGALNRFLTNSVTVACTFAFVMTFAVCWFVVLHSARKDAEEELLRCAEDIRADVESGVDELLFFVGNAICRHFKTPEAMTQSAVKDVMSRYNVDELNVVDDKGVVIAGAIADIGFDMASNPKSAEFNCLLSGTKTYSQPFRGAIENPALRRKYAGVAFPPPAKGYIQIGLDEHRVKDDLDYWFANIAVGWRFADGGFHVVAKSETGEIDSCGKEDGQGESVWRSGDTLASVGFDATSAPADGKAFFISKLYGEDCLCLSEVLCFHRVISAIPMASIRRATFRTMGANALVLFVVFALVAVFMTRLTDLVASLKGYIAAEKANQEKDLAVARTVQTSSLPVIFPDESDFRIVARMDTAREVGGDFYDFYPLPSGRILFLIADVSGKGVPAAMFMMRARTILKACALQFPDTELTRIIEMANDRLASTNAAEMFVTAWIGVYDRATGEVRYVNAGHNPPLAKRADGTVAWVKGRRSLVLAAMEGIKYHEERMTLAPGDSLCLYTDGVTEAMNTAGDLYGEARLERTLQTAGVQFVDEIRADVAKFAAGAEQSDDISMVALDRKAARKE